MKINKSFLILAVILILVIGYFVITNYSSEDESDIPTNQTTNTNASSSLGNWWEPSPAVTWQWQLSGDINTTYDVDIYDVDLVDTPQATINALHNRGIKVICYFSAGSWEKFRNDANEFPDDVLGNVLDGWPDEKWLDISNYEKFSDIMEARLDMAVAKGCDGVEPDNVDGYQNKNGLSLTYNDQIIYNKWLAVQAHARGLAIGLKNDLDQIEDLVGDFDFAVNEQCFEYDECEALTPFTDQGNAVLGVEYELEAEDFCEQANSMQFSWLKMDYDLDGGRVSCR